MQVVRLEAKAIIARLDVDAVEDDDVLKVEDGFDKYLLDRGSIQSIAI